MTRRLLLAAVVALVVAAPASAFSLRQVARGFDQPTFVTAAPGEPGKLYVVEQTGRIQELVGGRRSVFLDIHDLVSCCGERGLLSVAFHPDYAKNHRFFVDYTDGAGDTRVVEYRSRAGGAPVRVRQLLFVDQPYPNHNGGQLEFGPDGQLWVGMGDGGAGGDPENRAQNLSVRLGKLLRIAVDSPGARVTIAAYGLRNPWRFSFDGGNLWVGDVGQGAWEEIDFLPRARLGTLPNFGWRVYEGRAQYQSGETPNSRGALVGPIAVYSHSEGCSVTGGYVYRGRAVPAAQGRYFYGDYCSGRIWSVPATAPRTPRVEALRVPQLTSWGLDSNGELLAVSQSGAIFRLGR